MTFSLKLGIEANADSKDVFGETRGTSVAEKIRFDNNFLNCDPFPYNGIPPNSRNSIVAIFAL
jgi:hypothetical protein